ncbi:hypothetical protein TNCV_3688091 [Trichonephila clavipes]|uniref:Uncharacterized protein n=1 Tax=Trichonephila clavipes TaxID=2585209 RepID=A0A8X6RC17_TRICX|nr:hypothetical protein TNCV_3688091 [Trichonephila clavipes]
MVLGKWTPEDWKLVMWSDESRHTLFCTDGRLRICRAPPRKHESILLYSPCARVYDGFIMGDTATIHRARSVRNWFVDPQSDFQHLPWQQCRIKRHGGP